jgi:hypothetical protein
MPTENARFAKPHLTRASVVWPTYLIGDVQLAPTRLKQALFKKIAATRVAQKNLDDRAARREAQRASHSHPFAQKSATRRDGSTVGRVSK